MRNADRDAPGQLRLLMVDDDAALLQTLRRWAERFAEVEVATCGQEAIERLREGGPFDAVLSDLEMKNGSGIDLATWLRDHRPGLYDRLVFMSGMAHPSLAGHDSVPRMTKPFPLGRLQELLTQITVTSDG